MAFITYRKYITSAEWKALAKKWKAAADYCCWDCGRYFREWELQVHHLTYARLGRERPEDLVVLCQPCHQGRHDHPDLIDRKIDEFLNS